MPTFSGAQRNKSWQEWCDICARPINQCKARGEHLPRAVTEGRDIANQLENGDGEEAGARSKRKRDCKKHWYLI